MHMKLCYSILICDIWSRNWLQLTSFTRPRCETTDGRHCISKLRSKVPYGIGYSSMHMGCPEYNLCCTGQPSGIHKHVGCCGGYLLCANQYNWEWYTGIQWQLCALQNSVPKFSIEIQRHCREKWRPHEKLLIHFILQLHSWINLHVWVFLQCFHWIWRQIM